MIQSTSFLGNVASRQATQGTVQLRVVIIITVVVVIIIIIVIVIVIVIVVVIVIIIVIVIVIVIVIEMIQTRFLLGNVASSQASRCRAAKIIIIIIIIMIIIITRSTCFLPGPAAREAQPGGARRST